MSIPFADSRLYSLQNKTHDNILACQPPSAPKTVQEDTYLKWTILCITCNQFLLQIIYEKKLSLFFIIIIIVIIFINTLNRQLVTKINIHSSWHFREKKCGIKWRKKISRVIRWQLLTLNKQQLLKKNIWISRDAL